MAKLSNPKAGSLQFWPRKRAAKFLPRTNWSTLSSKQGLLGWIAYKVGMASSVIKDNTEHSMAKGKKVTIPTTILELPPMKVFAVRFYKYSKAVKEVIVSNDKELKRVVRLPKALPNFDSSIPADYDDIRVIAYSLVNKTSVKKSPDVIELAVGAKDKLSFVKSLLNKELSPKELFSADLIDVKGLTIGKGLVGPVKRFGITLKQHKSEKGVRRPGSLGPWHPARVTFVTPMAGQLGMFTRVHYNLKVCGQSTIVDKNINPVQGFRHYGQIKTSYLVVKGSVQGPSKRQLLITPSFRPTKRLAKQKYELVEVLQ